MNYSGQCKILHITDIKLNHGINARQYERKWHMKGKDRTAYILIIYLKCLAFLEYH